MFARWFHVRVRAATRAIRQGRLDDALAIARELQPTDDSDYEKLCDALAGPLEARARLHRQAGRYREALADLDHLAALNREGTDARALRRQIIEEIQAAAEQTAEERAAWRRAAAHLRAGHLETGRAELERIDNPRLREQLGAELERRAGRAERLLQQADEALARGDVLAAVRHWDQAGREGHTAQRERLLPKLASACRELLDRWHAEGRIEALMAARSAVSALLVRDPALSDWDLLIELCGRAASQLAAADYTALRQTLLRLRAARGDVEWVRAALGALARIAEGEEQLLASPLGLYASMAPRWPAAERAGEVRTQEMSAASQSPQRDAVRLDTPLLVVVDGGGSSMLLTREQVRIGRAGSSAVVDIALPADVDSHHADVVRRGSDYFVIAHGPVEVNQRPTRQCLLHHGDVIALGRVRLTFHKPSSRSQTAVLQLPHRCRLAEDVGSVVLFCDTCLVGPALTCHIRTRENEGQVVLFERSGVLYVRQMPEGPKLGASPRAEPIVAGCTMELAGLRFTVKPYA